MKPDDPMLGLTLALNEAIKYVREADACLMSVKDFLYQMEAERDG